MINQLAQTAVGILSPLAVVAVFWLWQRFEKARITPAEFRRLTVAVVSLVKAMSPECRKELMEAVPDAARTVFGYADRMKK